MRWGILLTLTAATVAVSTDDGQVTEASGVGELDVPETDEAAIEGRPVEAKYNAITTTTEGPSNVYTINISNVDFDTADFPALETALRQALQNRGFPFSVEDVTIIFKRGSVIADLIFDDPSAAANLAATGSTGAAGLVASTETTYVELEGKVSSACCDTECGTGKGKKRKGGKGAKKGANSGNAPANVPTGTCDCSNCPKGKIPKGKKGNGNGNGKGKKGIRKDSLKDSLSSTHAMGSGDATATSGLIALVTVAGLVVGLTFMAHRRATRYQRMHEGDEYILPDEVNTWSTPLISAPTDVRENVDHMVA